MGRKNKKKTNNPQNEIVRESLRTPTSVVIALFLISVLQTIGKIVLFPLKQLIKKFRLFFSKQFYITLSKKIIIWERICLYYLRLLFRVIRTQIAFLRITLKWKFHCIFQMITTLHERSLPKEHIIFAATTSPTSRIKQLLPFFFLHKKKKIIPIRTITAKQKKHSSSSIVVRLFWFSLGGAVVFFIAVIPISLYSIFSSLPNPKLLTTRDIPVTTKIFDRKGKLLYEIFVDQNRTPMPLSEIPDNVKNATIAIEDKDFYHHSGFSVSGILRAAWETLIHNRIQGGSTITQQLIKSAILSPEIKISRKVKEVILAFWTEQIYSKNQILEMYLNQVPYGGTAWGIESASQTYFGKSVKNLNLAEAALLVGLPAAPSNYSPFTGDRAKAFDRQKEVLRRMVEDKYITQEQSDDAQKQTLSFASPSIPIHSPHFVMFVKNYLIKRYGERAVERGGLQITTTLDSDIQEKAESIVAGQVASLTRLQVGNGAALITNPKNGEILAMVGSKDYFNIPDQGEVNVTQALRQPGSSIKVVTYATALEQKKFTAISTIDDSPISFPIAGQAPYAPVNYDGKFHGQVPFRNALANSYNIPAVKILNTLGIDSMIDTAQRMGINSWDDRSRFGLSLTLGGGDVTMMDMAEVYGTLANHGQRIDLNPILSITDYAGRSIEQEKSLPVQAISPETAWIMSNILSDNNARSQAFGPNSQLVIPNKSVSVKTGTTNDKRDNWTIGYTPSFTVTVWVGNNDNTPMNPYLTSGVTGAAPIWHDIFIELLKDKGDEVAPKPNDLISIPCYGNKTEYFIKGTEPANGRCGFAPSIVPTPSPHAEIVKPSPLAEIINPLIQRIKRNRKR